MVGNHKCWTRHWPKRNSSIVNIKSTLLTSSCLTQIIECHSQMFGASLKVKCEHEFTLSCLTLPYEEYAMTLWASVQHHCACFGSCECSMEPIEMLNWFSLSTKSNKSIEGISEKPLNSPWILVHLCGEIWFVFKVLLVEGKLPGRVGPSRRNFWLWLWLLLLRRWRQWRRRRRQLIVVQTDIVVVVATTNNIVKWSVGRSWRVQRRHLENSCRSIWQNWERRVVELRRWCLIERLTRLHAESHRRDPALHVHRIFGFDEILATAVRLQHECVLLVGHLQCGRFARLMN